MNDTTSQINITALEISLKSLETLISSRMDSLEEKMNLKFENVISRIAVQEQNMERHTEENENAIKGFEEIVKDLKTRVENLEEAPAKRALKDRMDFIETFKQFVFKSAVVLIVGIIFLVVAGTVLDRTPALNPKATELIKKATGTGE